MQHSILPARGSGGRRRRTSSGSARLLATTRSRARPSASHPPMICSMRCRGERAPSPPVACIHGRTVLQDRQVDEAIAGERGRDGDRLEVTRYLPERQAKMLVDLFFGAGHVAHAEHLEVEGMLAGLVEVERRKMPDPRN